MKKPIDSNTYEAAQKRIEYIFNEFENIYVAFSGGKDSGVMLELAVSHATKINQLEKLSVFHLDYEAQYSDTTKYVNRVYESLDPRIGKFRCCVPVKCATCTSMTEDYWRPWDDSKKDLWVRDMPAYAIKKDNFDFLNDDTTDSDFQRQFSLWHHNNQSKGKTAALVGIRTDESLDRLRTIVSDKNINKYRSMPWTTRVHSDIYNAYPIYDWSVSDVWVANYRNNWDYNNLYNIFHYAGLSPHAMRVASPFHNSAKASLKLYKTIDPNTWGKMVSRVNGVNFTAMYGDTKAMGWKNIEKPGHFTWHQYAEFLLDTLPPEIAKSYRNKLEKSIRFWRDKGGVLNEQAVNDLVRGEFEFEKGSKTNYKTDKKPVTMEYIDDIKSSEFQSIPTWKRLCVTILKNDHVGKFMGFSQTKKELEKRKSAISKYKDL